MPSTVATPARATPAGIRHLPRLVLLRTVEMPYGTLFEGIEDFAQALDEYIFYCYNEHIS